MRKSKSLITVGIVGFLCGCGADPVPAASVARPLTSTDYTLGSSYLSEGRQYRLYQPSCWVNQTCKEAPLVFVLHGFGGADLGIAEGMGMADKGDQAGFFVVSLLGAECVPGCDPGCQDSDGDGHYPRGWNNNILPSLQITVDDVQYVKDVLTDVENQVNVDTHRVFAVGFSNGAMMTHRLAAEMPHQLAAVGVVASTISMSYLCSTLCLTNTQCACSWGPDAATCAIAPATCTSYQIPDATAPITVALINGTDDTTVRIDGDVTQCPSGLDPVPLKQSVDYWAAVNGCKGSPHLSTDPSGTVHRARFAPCQNHTEVVSLVVEGMGHEFPHPATGFSAPDALWNVLKHHHR